MEQDKIDVLSLNPTRTYEIAKAELRDKFVVSPKLGRICTVGVSSVFQLSPSIRFKTLGELAQAKFPMPPIGFGKRMILVCANDPTPVTFSDDVDYAKVRREGKVLKQVARQEASEEEAAKAIQMQVQAQIVLILTIGVTFLMGVIGFIGILKLWG